MALQLLRWFIRNLKMPDIIPSPIVFLKLFLFAFMYILKNDKINTFKIGIKLIICHHFTIFDRELCLQTGMAINNYLQCLQDIVASQILVHKEETYKQHQNF